jgi:hypothetical protein
MTNIWHSFYNLIIALWVGGISLFTFIVTPVIFRSFERDMAGNIVGKLFSGYFMYNLALSLLALILLITLRSSFTKWGFQLSMILVIAAVIINAFVIFKLHPEIKRIKEQVHSFETEDRNSEMRRKFGKLHALSATLNLLLLADGVTLLVLSSVLKQE